MKNKRVILFRLGAVVILAAIAAVMLVIGRGHTVYLDSKALDYNGQTYETPYKIVVYVDDEQVAKLYDGDRGMSTNIGQKFTMTLEITQEKGGEAVGMLVSMALPYNLDGIVVNLPGLLAGLPEEAYLSKFVPVPTAEETEEEAPPADDFGMLGMDDMTGLGEA